MDDDWTLVGGHAVVFRLRPNTPESPETVWAEPALGENIAMFDADDDGDLDLAIAAPWYWLDDHHDGPLPRGVYIIDHGEGLAPGTAASPAEASMAWVHGDATKGGFGITMGDIGDVDANGIGEVEFSGWKLEKPIVGDVEVSSNLAWEFRLTADREGFNDVNNGLVDLGDQNGDGFDDYLLQSHLFLGPIVDGVTEADEYDATVDPAPSRFYAGQLSPTGPRALVGPVSAGISSSQLSGVVIWPNLLEDPLILDARPDQVAGRAVSIGDLTGDGQPDLLLTIYGPGSGESQSLVWTNVAMGGPLSSAPIVIEGRYEHDALGFAHAIGDFDGDGQDDLALGVPTSPAVDSSRPGRVAVFRGPLTPGTYDETDASVIWYGSPHAEDGFGALLVAGDLDGDGVDELAVSAVNDNQLQPGGGAVYLFASPMVLR